MNEREFVEQLADLMDTEDEVRIDSVLEELEDWDSLSYVSFLAMCSRVAKTHVEPKEVRAAKTVRDLFDLVNR